LPGLNNLCPIWEDNKELPVFLIWINTTSWISVQSKIKDFYSNYLFKNCTVYYK
jgi:hypothetical protein